MSRGIKVGLGLLAVLIIAAFAFWFGRWRAPSAELVCENVMSIVQKEIGDSMFASVEECVKSGDYDQAVDQKVRNHAEQMKCYLKARSVEDISDCDDVSSS